MSELLRLQRKNAYNKKIAVEHKRVTQAALELEIVQDPEEAKYRIIDYEAARYIGAALAHHYPGHSWTIEVDSRNGIARIYLTQLSNREGYIYKLRYIDVHTFDREMMRVGGEILERFNIKRGKFNEADVVNRSRDLRGNAIVDLT